MREIKNLKELKEKLKLLDIQDEDKLKNIVCSLIGHSRISTTCFGYRYCARCGQQLGDSLGSIDFGKPDCVIVGHNCDICRANWKKLNWKDKFMCPTKKEVFAEEINNEDNKK